MKKMYALCLLALSFQVMLGWHPASVITEHGRPTPALQSLLNLLDVHHEGTLESIVQATQRVWLRPAGTERWQLTDSFPSETVEQMIPLFELLSLTGEIKPHKTHYAYALLLGARLKTVIKRVAYLIDQWNRGVRFKTLVILAGQRDLDQEVEGLDILLNSPAVTMQDSQSLKACWQSVKTETEMMRTVLDACLLPGSMRQDVQIVVIDAPKKQRPDGTFVRPNTADTIAQWLKGNPAPGCCLAISSQPHVLYQHSVLATLLPAEFDLESVGAPTHVQSNVSEILDALARLLYQENIRRQQKR